ncbi:PIG-L deacetylase family protein [Agromyces aerolatus]|uniref:PIG-L deacetylase family protein n=1 Tax=Agromyces sp. LY-1074 TaxID=3074080 RepID=UPI0028613A8E|nr:MULTISPECIES: PIG-L deacetylase family protein [unclassified Agromyces]MDR5700850.1 PIG-L deacetylase family protein [Agromyces sp. LY-1074]MDR5707489.1 PIG-L deacetylase family protein [Agromyces sp. LY-1358]
MSTSTTAESRHGPPSKVLVIAAHPDDVELCCAGTMARLAHAGHEVVLVHMTYGDKGGKDAPEVLARTRHDEATESASLIGASVDGRFCGDLELYPDEETIDRLGTLWRAHAPDVVFTHRPDDYHPDHRITGELALAAGAAVAPDTPIWFMDTVGAVEFAPTEVVDIAQTLELKVQMLECHRSQMTWMSAARHAHMPYMVRTAAGWRGLQAGIGLAEGFQPATPGVSWPFADVPSVPMKRVEEEVK